MKTRNTITKLIAMTMAVAAMAVIASSWAAGRAGAAVQGDTATHEVGHVLGLIPGERLSLSVARLSTTEAGSQPVRVQAAIYDSYGNLLRQTNVVEVPPYQFRTFNINRDDLRLAGEPGTERLEVRAVIQVVSMDGSGRPVNLTVSMERVDNRTGATTGGSYSSGYVKVSDD